MTASLLKRTGVDRIPPIFGADPVLSEPHDRLRPAVLSLPAMHWEQAGRPSARSETVAAECPIALVYNGVSHAVMMASPVDLVDLGLGFSIAEGIVGELAEVGSVDVVDMVLGMEVRLEIPTARAAALDERRRSMTGGTACGLCGIISIERAIRPLPSAAAGPRVAASAIAVALEALPATQATNRLTGAMHAAAMVSTAGEILLVREDVGRHNALDKLVGAAALIGIDPGKGFLVLTSRCSTEMVQKAVTAGFTILVAISAPTSLAISLAEEANLTLAAFARGHSFTVYTGSERIACP